MSVAGTVPTNKLFSISCRYILSAIFILLPTLLMPVNLFAQSSGGGYFGSYLQRDVGARAIALGGAYTAVVNEPMAIFYNPAGLDNYTADPFFSTSYSFLEFGRTHSALAWGQSFFENIGFGVGINNFTSGNIIGRDIRGNRTQDFTDWQFAISGGASYTMEFASFGLAVKYLSSAVTGTGTRADGVALDLGSKFNVMDLFTFGLAIQNLAGVSFWNTDYEETNLLPFRIRTGIAMEYGLNDDEYVSRSTVSGELETVYVPATRYVLLSLDAILTQFEAGPNIILGVEAVPHEIIGFRGGISIIGDDMGAYKFLPMNTWGGGVSIRPELEEIPFNMIFDYSVSNDYLATNNISHHLSIIIEFIP